MSGDEASGHGQWLERLERDLQLYHAALGLAPLAFCALVFFLPSSWLGSPRLALYAGIWIGGGTVEILTIFAYEGMAVGLKTVATLIAGLALGTLSSWLIGWP